MQRELTMFELIASRIKRNHPDLGDEDIAGLIEWDSKRFEEEMEEAYTLAQWVVASEKWFNAKCSLLSYRLNI